MRIMSQQLILKTSNDYIAKCLLKGAVFWITFNIITGLLTGDASLNDNYFILFLIISYIAFIASYTVKIDRGHITTYQAAMVTNNINLYKASEVVKEKDRVIIIYPDDARYPIKFSRFGKSDQSKVLEFSTPQAGARPKAVPEIIEQDELRNAKKIINKDISYLRTVWIPFALFAGGFPIYTYIENGFSALDIFLLPIYIMCGLMAWSTRNSEKNEILICQQYLKIDDRNPSRFYWEDITDFTIAHQFIPKAGNVVWLKIHFSNEDKYFKKGILSWLNSLVIGDGVHVCNLATYKVNNDELLFNLKKALDEYSPNKLINKDK
jgi:hypothetical protein